MELERARPAIDLARYHFKRDRGDMTIYGTWLYNHDQEDTEPALVILPRYRLNGAVPCCVALSAAFKYNNPRYLAHAARHFAKTMGFEDEMSRVRKVAEFIHDHMLDLLKMPVDPTEAVVVGEAKVDLGNGRKRTVEFLDHEQLPQA